MSNKLPLLHQAIDHLKKDNQTDLANELTILMEELLTNIENEKTAQIEQSTQAIDTFLETHKTLLQENEELAQIRNRKSDLQSLKASINGNDEESEEDTEEKKWSRRERRGKTATKIAAGVGALFALFKLRGKSSSQTPTTNTPLPASTTTAPNREQLPISSQRHRVLEEMEKIIAADKVRPIGYEFDDISLKENDRDINCSWLVYEIVQRRAWFNICSGWVTSASLYQSMLNKWWSAQPLLKKWTQTPYTQWIQPGDTIFWASTNRDFKWRNGSRPAKVNGMPIHHSALIQSVQPDGSFTVIESTWSTGVQVKTYTAQRWLDKRKDELHVVRMPYESIV